MASDKPLQDIFTNVRIPVTDSVVAVDTYNQYRHAQLPAYGSDYGMLWNCYPQYFSDRSQNQYSSQFDTWVTKRGGIGNPLTEIDTAVLTNTSNSTVVAILCMSQMEDVWVVVVYDSTAGNHKVIQYKPIAGTSLLIGTIAASAVTDTIYLTEITVAGVPNLMIVRINVGETASSGTYAAATGAGPTYTAFTAALTNIGDANFPSNLGKVLRGPAVQMDGYTFVFTRDGAIYNSTLNTIATWTHTGTAMVVQAIAYPDQGVGLVRYKNHIIAFGEDSMEFFNNVGNPAPKSPLGRTDQAFIKFGCPFGKSIISMDDTVYWWAKSSTGKFGLYKLDGYTPVKVSTLREDLLASRQPNFPELYSFTDRGRQHIISTIQAAPNLLNLATSSLNSVASGGGFPIGQPSGAVSGDPFSLASSDFANGYLCWDIATSGWWVYSNAGTGTSVFPMQAQNFSLVTASSSMLLTTTLTMLSNGPPRTINGTKRLGNKVYNVYADPLSGGTGTWADNVPNPNGNDASTNAVTGAIQFNVWDFGNENRKRIHKFKVIQRQYGVSSTSPSFAPYTWVVYNKSDGDYDDSTAAQLNTTRFWRRFYSQNPAISRTYINNLGTARKWYFGVINKSDNPWTCKAIELDISQSR